MIAASTQKDKDIALFGLGGSGIATALSLKEGGANLVCYDDNPASVEKAQKLGLATHDLREVDFSKIDALVLAPGVPLTHPKPHWTVELANDAGTPIIGDIELFLLERNAIAPDTPFIAITGTNGKSTSTALIAHVLKSAGQDVQMGGNIGTAILSLDALGASRIYVVEISSYQIDLAPSLNPTVGILLNLAPDHLDRHGTMERYAAIKAIVPSNSGLAIIGVDDEYSQKIAAVIKQTGALLECVSMSSLEDGIFADEQLLVEGKDGSFEVLFDLSEAATLPGKHNAQNAGAAWAACREVGLSAEEIRHGFRSFPGLEHRLEQIGSVGDVSFVNDSKGTNSDAAAVALSSFENIYWIAGGLPKEGGIENLNPYFSRVKRAYLIGEAAPQFAATIGNKIEFEISETLDVAVNNAAQDAANDDVENPVVLLSPACASFDQYPNFEKRGEAFRTAAISLSGFVSYADQQLLEAKGHQHG